MSDAFKKLMNDLLRGQSTKKNSEGLEEHLITDVIDLINYAGRVGKYIIDADEGTCELSARISTKGCGCRIVGFKFGDQLLNLTGREAIMFAERLEIVSTGLNERVQAGLLKTTALMQIFGGFINMKIAMGGNHAEVTDVDKEFLDAAEKFALSTGGEIDEDVGPSIPKESELVEGLTPQVKACIEEFGIVTAKKDLPAAMVERIGQMLADDVKAGVSMGYVSADGELIRRKNEEENIAGIGLALVSLTGGKFKMDNVAVVGFDNTLSNLAEAVESWLVEKDLYDIRASKPLAMMKVMGKCLSQGRPTDPKGMEALRENLQKAGSELAGVFTASSDMMDAIVEKAKPSSKPVLH
jgi:hypothetical protein